MRVDPLSGAELPKINADTLLDGTVVIEGVKNLSLVVPASHEPQGVVAS